MPIPQPDLFSTSPPAKTQVSDEVAALIRQKLHATLHLAQSAESMPWADVMQVIREENAFRHAKDLLPPEEGARLWLEFDREMDRLYALAEQAEIA